MRAEVCLTGSMTEGGEFASQDYRLSLSDDKDELSIEIVESDMTLFIDLDELQQALFALMNLQFSGLSLELKALFGQLPEVETNEDN